jgi:hypothetical protein
VSRLPPFHITTTKENRAKPPKPVSYRLIVERDGTITSFHYTFGDGERGAKWHQLHLIGEVLELAVEMLAKAFAQAKVDASPQLDEGGNRFLAVIV